MTFDDADPIPAFDRCGPAELDALSIGVVKMRTDGVVVACNRAESALSGRPPDQVIGRDFFVDVAPCAAGAPHMYLLIEPRPGMGTCRTP
jgi:photoactive yellow protein